MKRLALILTLAACGTTSTTGTIVTTTETGQEDLSQGCVAGNNNHMEDDGACHCDEGYAWCTDDPMDPDPLACCPEGP